MTKQNNSNSLTKQNTQQLTLISEESLTKFNEIQRKVNELQKLETNEMSQMAIAAAKANVIAELRKALSRELVENMKKNLENNRLGFLTDKDGGYSIDVIRDCMIESAVAGFYWHGNEFNIIGGNSYFTKEGFTNKIKRTEDFTDMNIDFSIPKYEVENKRATVKIKANWKYRGKPLELKIEIPIKLTIDKYGKNWSTDDAILGKAERKIKAKIWELSTGVYLPDADADDLKFKNAHDVDAQVIEEIEVNANKVPIDVEVEESGDLFSEEEKAEIEAQEKVEAEKENMNDGSKIGF